MASNLALCNGDTDGSVTLDADGGDGSFMYTLNGITQSSPVFTNLAPNVYPGMVEDENGCNATISVTVTAADAIVANIIASDLEVCNGETDGSVTITASGGDDDFTFEIDGVEQTSNVFDNLDPGPHMILIRDGNNCTTTPINFTVDEAPAITADIDDANSDLLICDDGSCLLYTSPSPRDLSTSRMPSSA